MSDMSLPPPPANPPSLRSTANFTAEFILTEELRGDIDAEVLADASLEVGDGRRSIEIKVANPQSVIPRELIEKLGAALQIDPNTLKIKIQDHIYTMENEENLAPGSVKALREAHGGGIFVQKSSE